MSRSVLDACVGSTHARRLLEFLARQPSGVHEMRWAVFLTEAEECAELGEVAGRSAADHDSLAVLLRPNVYLTLTPVSDADSAEGIAATIQERAVAQYILGGGRNATARVCVGGSVSEGRMAQPPDEFLAMLVRTADQALDQARIDAGRSVKVIRLLVRPFGVWQGSRVSPAHP